MKRLIWRAIKGVISSAMIHTSQDGHLKCCRRKDDTRFQAVHSLSSRTSNYTVVTDHIITVKIDQQTTTRFEELFSSVKSERDVIPQQIESLFSAKVRATLTTERNLAKATKLKKKFSEFFGETVLTGAKRCLLYVALQGLFSFFITNRPQRISCRRANAAVWVLESLSEGRR